jgi:hypothetical protein
MQKRGEVRHTEYKLRVLDSRQEMTGADRQWAAQYEPGHMLRYSRGSKVLNIAPGEYARVESVEAKENHLTIERENGEYQSYDPRRLSGVSVYDEVERLFSQGDRVQFTAPSKDLRVANRELGTIREINDAGDLAIQMDSGRDIQFNVREHPHLDHGYAVTSHSSQGQTAERVLIDVDTEKSRQLVNSRLAYVLYQSRADSTTRRFIQTIGASSDTVSAETSRNAQRARTRSRSPKRFPRTTKHMWKRKHRPMSQRLA